ncbi:MAG: YbhB/YbcL family Raf kinase inhibitor-like protein [Candidatus Methanomethylophilaceae archaeon]|nr:YbhB/YbcL family Raf kinase inhibitor-like protein [Candidatus Methanomethylophilaceae archaeon]
MKVTSEGIVDGYFLDKYGGKGSSFIDGMPSLSIPFKIEDAPAGTMSFAVILDDYDAVPVCGFDWIHWIVADLKKTEVKEGESRRSKEFVEGRNSWSGKFDRFPAEKATGYGGMSPPDKVHRYTLKVYALDCELGLEKGFGLNDLIFAMMGHVLARSMIIGKYGPAKK